MDRRLGNVTEDLVEVSSSVEAKNWYVSGVEERMIDDGFGVGWWDAASDGREEVQVVLRRRLKRS